MLIDKYLRSTGKNIVFDSFLKKSISNNLFSYLLISFLIAFYRIIFMWRKPMSAFYADENNWYLDATNTGLLEYVTTLDAGYFVPVTRLIFWVITKITSTPELAIHFFSCLVSAFCASSILLFKSITLNNKTKVFISISLGIFQSFDLLLWININYYVFIVCVLVLIDRFISPSERVGKKKTFLLFLSICTLGKPQLIACCNLMLMTIVFVRFTIKKSKLFNLKVEIVSITLLGSLLIFSRINSEALELNLTFNSILLALTGLLKVPLSVLVPLPTIGLTQLAKIFDNSMFTLYSNIVYIVASIWIYVKFQKIVRLEKSLIYVVSIIPIYLSLFVFRNTGWATDFFWQTPCVSCMSSRHIFPLYVLLILFIGQFLRSKYVHLVMIQLLLLNLIYYLTQQIV